MGLIDNIRQLRDVDRRLRTDGINVKRLAKELKLTEKTIHRLLAMIRELIGPTEVTEVPPASGTREGTLYVHRYAPKVPEFFAKRK